MADPPLVTQPYARVDPGVAEVDEQVGEDEEQRREQHAADDDGDVALADSPVDHETDAGSAEHRFDDEGAADERAEVDAGDGQDRRQAFLKP